MKKTVVIVAAVCIIIIVGVVLVLTGVISLGDKKTENSNQKKETVICIPFSSAYIGTDEDGVVTETLEEKPEGTVLISGISFKRIVEGEKVGTEDDEGFQYALLVFRELKNNGIDSVTEINVGEDGTVSFFMEQVCVLLGKDNQTGRKISDLSEFYSKVIQMAGTLDMQKVSEDNQGYTFKKAQSEEKVDE